MAGFHVCPEIILTASSSGTLDILAFSNGAMGPTLPGGLPYALVVSINGEYVAAELVADDVER